MTDDLLRKFAELNPVADPDRLVALDAPDLPADPVLRALLEHTRTDNGRPDRMRSAHVRNAWPAHTRGATQRRNGDMQTTKVRPDQRPAPKPRSRTLAGVGAAAAVILAVIAGLVVLNDRDPAPMVSETGQVAGRANGDVLSFTGNDDTPGDLVAVNRATGEERVLAEDLNDVRHARWSADGQWVAFRMQGWFWVVDATSEPRQIFKAPPSNDVHEPLWAWSFTGARLAVIYRSTLSVIDPSTGLVTELASIATTDFDVPASPATVTSPPAWSPDGTTILFGTKGGSIHSVDVNTGERSVFVQLPDEDIDSIDELAWPPDGSRLAILADLGTSNSLFVINADRSDLLLLVDPVADRWISEFDWSPDGSRITYTTEDGDGLRIFVAPVDGSTPSLVATIHENDTAISPVWSPDGTQIAVGHRIAHLTADARNFVVDADGSGDAAPLDDLTYESWRGGSYSACSPPIEMFPPC